MYCLSTLVRHADSWIGLRLLISPLFRVVKRVGVMTAVCGCKLALLLAMAPVQLYISLKWLISYKYITIGNVNVKIPHRKKFHESK